MGGVTLVKTVKVPSIAMTYKHRLKQKFMTNYRTADMQLWFQPVMSLVAKRSKFCCNRIHKYASAKEGTHMVLILKSSHEISYYEAFDSEHILETA